MLNLTDSSQNQDEINNIHYHVNLNLRRLEFLNHITYLTNLFFQII